MDEGPKTNLDFYSAAATVIPGLLIAVAIQDASWAAHLYVYLALVSRRTVSGLNFAGQPAPGLERRRRPGGARRSRRGATSGAARPGW
jgi:hypothetical protein